MWTNLLRSIKRSFLHFSPRSTQSCVQFPAISVIARLWRKCAAIFHEKTDINVEREQGYNFNRGCVNRKKFSTKNSPTFA